MARRITGYFVVLLLLLDPSSAFLADKCNIDLDFQKVLKQGKIDAEDVLQAAIVLSKFFQENPDLAQNYSSTNNFVKELVRQGTSIITANLAYFGVTIYLGTVVLTSYCVILIDSHIQHLDEPLHAFVKKVLNSSIRSEIQREVQPILQYIETLLNKCTENGSVKTCQGVNFEEMKMQLKQRMDIIVNILIRFIIIRGQFPSVEEVKQNLQNGANEVALFCAVVVAGIALTAESSRIIYNLLGALLALPVICINVKELAYVQLDPFFRNYQKALQLLEKMKVRAFEAKKAITKLQTDLEIARHYGFRSTNYLLVQEQGEDKNY